MLGFGVELIPFEYSLSLERPKLIYPTNVRVFITHNDVRSLTMHSARSSASTCDTMEEEQITLPLSFSSEAF